MHNPNIYERPSPGQAFRIASIGMTLANRQGKTRPSREAENAHLFLPERSEEAVVTEQEKMMIKTHGFLGRIAKVGYRQWSMRITEPFWAESDDQSDWTRSIYKIEWTSEEVMKAEKQIIIARDEEAVSDLVPEQIDPTIFLPDLIHAERELRTLTAADCELLVSDMRDFSRGPKLKLTYSNGENS